MTETKKENEREIVLAILIEVLEKNQFSHIVIRQALDKYSYLPQKDRSFIARLSRGCVERKIELDAIIDKAASVKASKQKPVIRNILRMAAYQLKYMDVPEHAVCSEAVNLAAKKGFWSLKGFVNAVTRKMAVLIPTLDWSDQPSVYYSVPQWLYDKLLSWYPKEKVAAYLESVVSQSGHPMYVHCHTGRYSIEEIVSSLEKEGISVTKAPYADDCLELTDAGDIRRTKVFQDGLIQIQDISSALAAQCVAPQENSFCIDMCAAPGGKSIHLAKAKGGTTKVLSRDISWEKVELIEVEEDDAVMNFHFPAPPAGAHSVVRLEKVSKHYGSVSVFENVDFEIVKGDRIAIVGVNGAGKSTFSRLISGGEAPSSGSVTMGRHTQVAFFSQTHADDLDPEKTILECVEAAATRESAPMVRNLLGCFLFRGDDVHKRVGVLSGGERSRVALVCMLLHPANFLILDEPTNHLDIQSQQVLQQALSEYPGSYCIVSHNRSFLDPIVTKVLEFVPGEKPRVYLGNVSDYLEKVERNQALAAAAALPPSGAAEPGAGLDRKARRRMEAEIRQKKTRLLRPLQEKLELLEEEIARLETEKTEITSQLERPDVAADTEAVMELTSRFQQTDRQLETCFTQWADLSEKIEETEARIQEEAERNVSGS